jgi:glycyl-tRNA synthetase
MEIFNELRFDHEVMYEEKDSIGKRYRRQDALGTPYCITIDHDTLEDSCVTLRDRDTMIQERVSISHLGKIITDKVGVSTVLRNL